jgi:hypothetical protein
MSAMRIVLLCAWLAALPALAQNNAAAGATNNASAEAIHERLEQVRTACIAGRRHVCGRVLQVTPAGLVVDSGYPTLLQPPLDHSWITPAVAAPARPDFLMESNAPGAIALGLVCLTDFPRRPKVRQYDYVALTGYPAGQYDYVPVAGVKKTIRRFAGGLETAVKLSLQAGEH